MSAPLGGPIFSVDRARFDLLEPSHATEHVWIMAVTYRLTADTISRGKRGEQVILDAENLAVAAIGCWRCEGEWSEKISRRPCPGEPG